MSGQISIPEEKIKELELLYNFEFDTAKYGFIFTKKGQHKQIIYDPKWKGGELNRDPNDIILPWPKCSCSTLSCRKRG